MIQISLSKITFFVFSNTISVKVRCYIILLYPWTRKNKKEPEWRKRGQRRTVRRETDWDWRNRERKMVSWKSNTMMLKRSHNSIINNFITHKVQGVGSTRVYRRRFPFMILLTWYHHFCSSINGFSLVLIQDTYMNTVGISVLPCPNRFHTSLSPVFLFRLTRQDYTILFQIFSLSGYVWVTLRKLFTSNTWMTYDV